MTNILRGLIAGLACVACGVTAYAGGPFGIIRVGLWQGAAYTNDKGLFSHCTDRTWIIGVTDPSWQLRDREIAFIASDLRQSKQIRDPLGRRREKGRGWRVTGAGCRSAA